MAYWLSRCLQMKHYNVTLISNTHSPQICAVQLHDESDDSLIELSFDGNTLSGTGIDFFEAFCKIREQLEPLGLLPQCYACLLYTSPSPRDRG